LKKQGILPLTFQNAADYDKLRKGDLVNLRELSSLAPGGPVRLEITPAAGGEIIEISLNHSLTAEQIEWFKAGTALNYAAKSA
jgi:aconitate hydratase